MKKSISDYNSRQLNLMIKQIEFYIDHKMTISELIGRLESLLSVLEDVPDGWKNEFLSLWGHLEVDYAIFLNMKEYESETVKILKKSTKDSIEELLFFLKKTLICGSFDFEE